MNVKRINEILGYVFFSIGALKILIIILSLLNIVTIINGGSLNYRKTESYTAFGTFIAILQLVLGIVAIIMIGLNNKITGNEKVINGYFLTLGAIAIELLFPRISGVYSVFISSGIYMSAGNLIRKGGFSENINYKKKKKQVDNTDWFYKDN